MKELCDNINNASNEIIQLDEKYQNLGIGNQLYITLENYIVKNTDIKTVYLACNKI